VKKILLVNPPFVYFPGNERSRYNYCRPPLGLCYLASYLRSNRPGEYGVEIIDTLIERKTPGEWVELIAGKRPDIVGFSAVTPTSMETKRMAARLRELSPEVFLVAGGPHCTIRPGDMFPEFDAVVRGEGEQTLLELVDAVAGGGSLGEINGVSFTDGEEVIDNQPRELVRPLDEIPPPARDLLKSDEYYHSFPYRHSGAFTTAFTCRGCPNNCYFCGNEALWNRKIRFHSIEYVELELDEMVNRQGVSLLFYDDDDFLASKQRAARICESIMKLAPGLKWICHACVSSIDDESIKMMKRAGCVEMQVGVESGNDEILSRISKCAGREEVTEKFRILRKNGMNSWATFIIGHEGETPLSARDTIDFAIELEPAYASFILLLPFPGSRAFDIFKKNGWLKTENWDDYTWHGDPVFEMPGLDADELVKLRGEAQKKFYLRPKKLLWLVAHTLLAGSLREMLRNFFAWLTVVRQSHG